VAGDGAIGGIQGAGAAGVERDLEVVVVVAAYGGDEGTGCGFGLGSGGRRRPWLRGGFGFRLHLGEVRNWVWRSGRWDFSPRLFEKEGNGKWRAYFSC
jgi:hypothetical protein